MKRELTHFIRTSAAIEWRGDDKLLCWITFDKLEEFVSILGDEYFCGGGIDGTILYDSFVFDIFPFITIHKIDAEDLEE